MLAPTATAILKPRPESPSNLNLLNNIPNPPASA